MSTPLKKEFQITQEIAVGGRNKLLIIAGPCQMESLDHTLEMAHALKDLCQEFPVNLIFKASFDKANRTSLKGARGLGLEEGLEILAQVRAETKLPVLTDIHSPEQAEIVARTVDVLQTPAFLCRQTDLLAAAGKTGKPVHVKKGQFLHPSDMKHVAQKVAATGNDRIMLCERGSCFGYRDLVVDPRSLVLMGQIGYPVILDITHSVQSMGGGDGASSGSREFAEPLARAGAALGVDGIFLECHEKPERAPSDGASMLPLKEVKPLLDIVCRIRSAVEK